MLAKIYKKLKMVDLQLKKQKQDSKQGVDDTTNIVQGEGYVITDRNSLLEKLKKLTK